MGCAYRLALSVQRKEARTQALQSGRPLVIHLASRLRSPKNARNNTFNKRVLWEQNPRCRWCNTLTRLPGPGDRNPEHDWATIDHVYPRMDPKRGGNENVVVLACHLCNQRRDLWAKVKWRRELTEVYGRIRRVDPERRAATLQRMAELA